MNAFQYIKFIIMSFSTKYLYKLENRNKIEIEIYQTFFTEIKKSNEEISKLREKNKFL